MRGWAESGTGSSSKVHVPTNALKLLPCAPTSLRTAAPRPWVTPRPWSRSPPNNSRCLPTPPAPSSLCLSLMPISPGCLSLPGDLTVEEEPAVGSPATSRLSLAGSGTRRQHSKFQAGILHRRWSPWKRPPSVGRVLSRHPPLRLHTESASVFFSKYNRKKGKNPTKLVLVHLILCLH